MAWQARFTFRAEGPVKCILHRKPDNRLIQVKVDATEAAQRFLTDDLQEDLRRAILDVVEADLFGHQLRQKSLPEAAPSGGLVLEVGRAPCGIWDKFRCAQNDQTLTLQVQKFDFLLREYIFLLVGLQPHIAHIRINML